jgi:hypothetical protein
MERPELTDIHESFLTLSLMARERFGGSLGGRLLLRQEFNAEGAAVVIAASVAEAASLCVDSNAERLRDGLRGGYVDFVVATLDEALRILKNEVRRARAVSVGVTGDPQACIADMTERGLQPDLLSGGSLSQTTIFRERGATTIPESAPPDPETSLLVWSFSAPPLRSMKRVSELAQAALDAQRADTAARLRWLEQSPRYLGRAFATRQCLRMTSNEIAACLPCARAEFPDLQVTRDGQAV